MRIVEIIQIRKMLETINQKEKKSQTSLNHKRNHKKVRALLKEKLPKQMQEILKNLFWEHKTSMSK